MSTIPAGYTVNNATTSLPPTQQTAQQLNTEFMTLLMAQLQNQDPTNPVDDTQMLAQQAQFSSLEQMQTLNQNFVSMMAMQNVSQATNLIGRTITASINGASPVSGVVSGVSFSNGTPSLLVNIGGTATSVLLSDVTQVNL